MDEPDWTTLSDEALLERRISKLGLRLEGFPTREELDRRRLQRERESS